MHAYIDTPATHIHTPAPPPPKIYTRLFHTIPQVASLHWTLLIYAENTVNNDTIVPFAMCACKRAATSRRFDMCINLAPNSGHRFMIVYVLEKLKCWRACYFYSSSTNLVLFAFYSVLWCVTKQHSSIL